MKPELTKKLSTLVKLALLVAAGIAALILEHRQSNFGEMYAAELQKMHSELRLNAIEFGGEQSYVVFEVSKTSISDTTSDEYLKSLASDVRKIYCKQIENTEVDLGITLFHVNVRTTYDGNSNIILSHPLSQRSCI